MRTTLLWRAAAFALLLAGLLSLWGARGARAVDELPRFTEEREAAALYFVKKHLPELLSLLDELKKASKERYQREIREIFHVTELLAELRDDTQRYALELKIWVAENRAHVLIARLSTPKEEDRKKAQADLQELTKQLVELDLEALDLKAEQLDRELSEVKDELARIREGRDKYMKERYDGLLQRVQKRKK
jgi:hypothetical protein